MIFVVTSKRDYEDESYVGFDGIFETEEDAVKYIQRDAKDTLKEIVCPSYRENVHFSAHRYEHSFTAEYAGSFFVWQIHEIDIPEWLEEKIARQLKYNIA